jgi:hypothetical protein
MLALVLADGCIDLQFDGIGWDGDLVLSLVLVLVGISVGGGGWR